MRLVERHYITKNHRFFAEIDSLSFLSKNLYNRANYIIRQEFIETSKEKESGEREFANWIRYNEIQKTLQNEKDVDYKKLPAKVSQQILMLLDKNWISFFNSCKEFKKHPSTYTGRPKLPKYKHKTKGRNVLVYTDQTLSKKYLKKGIVHLSNTKIFIHTKQENIKQVRIVPKNNEYVIEIIYEKEIKTNENLDKTFIAGIDIGLNNLATITSNKKLKPLIINGRPLKAINQYYNKKKAKLQSFVKDKGTSNRIVKLTNKRNKKIDNYLHNASRYIVNYLLRENISTLVIGKNDGWKQDINIGCKNNQNFVSVPHARFINMLIYKCELEGISCILQEESYTSKCSFLDMEDMCHHDTYLGKRISRGRFTSSHGITINADCNGSGNIIRKAFPNAFVLYGIEGVVVHPVRLTPYKINFKQKI